jgi:hypothetical protein
MSRRFALLLASSLALGGSGCTGCPTALLEATLVANGTGGLAVQAPEGGVVLVDWPSGVGVGHEGDQLVLTNPLGQPIAHQGEFVSMASGVPGDTLEFAACGPIAVSASRPPAR